MGVNTEVDHQKMGEGMGWIQLIRRNTAINIRVSQYAWNFSVTRTGVRFARTVAFMVFFITRTMLLPPV